MIESFPSHRHSFPTFIKQANLARAFQNAPNPPQRQIETSGQFNQFVAFSGGGGEHQFVIVAARQLTVAGQDGVCIFR